VTKKKAASVKPPLVTKNIKGSTIEVAQPWTGNSQSPFDSQGKFDMSSIPPWGLPKQDNLKKLGSSVDRIVAKALDAVDGMPEMGASTTPMKSAASDGDSLPNQPTEALLTQMGSDIRKIPRGEFTVKYGSLSRGYGTTTDRLTPQEYSNISKYLSKKGYVPKTADTLVQDSVYEQHGVDGRYVETARVGPAKVIKQGKISAQNEMDTATLQGVSSGGLAKTGSASQDLGAASPGVVRARGGPAFGEPNTYNPPAGSNPPGLEAPQKRQVLLLNRHLVWADQRQTRRHRPWGCEQRRLSPMWAAVRFGPNGVLEETGLLFRSGRKEKA
jgi:hypothetical protein